MLFWWIFGINVDLGLLLGAAIAAVFTHFLPQIFPDRKKVEERLKALEDRMDKLEKKRWKTTSQ